MDRLHDPAFQRRKAAVQLLQLFTAEARRFAVHMEQAVHVRDTPPPPRGPFPGLNLPSVVTTLPLQLQAMALLLRWRSSSARY